MAKPLKDTISIYLIATLIFASAIAGYLYTSDSAEAAVAYVQGNGAQNESADNTTEVSFLSNVTAGNVIAVAVSWISTTATLNTISDTCGTSYTIVGNPTTGANGRAAMAYGVIGSSGSCTVTATLSATLYSNIIVHEISGVDTNSPLDNNQYAFNYQTDPGTGTDGVTSGNITTTQAGDYIFGVALNESAESPTYTPGTNYTGRQSITLNGFPARSEDRIQSSAGSIAATFTSSVSWADTITGIMAFKPASSPSIYPQVKIRGGSGWYHNDWLYRKLITVQKDKVVSSQTDFPLLVDLTDSGLQANAQTDGDDILFTTGNGITKIPHEIELYTNSTGRLTAWVKVPTLSSDSNTAIYMYYGNAATSSEQLPTQVWDSNYRAVWHLGDGDSTDADFYTDSTSYGNHGTLTDANLDLVATDGKIDGAIDFSTDAGDLINAGTDSSLDILGNITLSGWFTLDSYDNYYQLFVAKDEGTVTSYVAGVNNTAKPFFLLTGDGTTQQQAYGATTLSGSTLYYVVGVYNGTDMRVYLNGVLDTNGANNPKSYTGAIYDSAGYLRINGSTDFASNEMPGIKDEIRISAYARSADWIGTEYNNQSATSTFYTVGIQETKSGITTPGVKIRGGSSSGSDTPAFVQSTSNNDDSTDQISFGSVTAGNVIAIAGIWTPTTIALNSITAPCVGGGFTLVNNPTLDSTVGTEAAMGYGVVTSSGACTITLNFSGTDTAVGILAHEISGVNTSSPFDGSAMQEQFNPADVDAFTSGSIVTTENGDYIFGVGFDVNINDDLTPGSGFAGRITSQVTGRGDTEDQIQTSAGSIEAKWTASTVFRGITAGIMAFKPATTAGVSGSVKFR